MAITGKDLGIALAINFAVCVVCLLIFSYLRIHEITRKFYMPRR
jgi:hypothetical protein